jgi:F-type H+-transporting ATPase subunit alpha
MKKKPDNKETLKTALNETLFTVQNVLEEHKPQLEPQEIGTIDYVGNAIIRVSGIPNVKSEELIQLPGKKLGLALNLDPEEVTIVLLDESENIESGQEVSRTGRVMDVKVGEELLGRVVDAMSRPLDEGEAIHTTQRLPLERKAPGIMDRAPVNIPLQTGIQVIDALIPVGRGQRELILGDRQTGKTAIAIDTIINQKDTDIISIYCSIGQRTSAVARVVADLRKYDAIKNCIVVVATGEDSPGLNFITPYAATSMAEYFMEKGRDVLIIYDDLTRHARAYRELSLLMRRPPAREAYPGDIFYIHSRLLERSTHLSQKLGGGSLTALPIIETQAQNISAYIPTNLVSITDGQIYLSPTLFQEGVLPAVDVGKSVSRVGGKTQLDAYRAVAGDLRLSYSQFEELETFARFGTQLDEETLKTLKRGRRVREVLKQSQYSPISVPEQIAVLVAVTGGILDDVDLEEIAKAEDKIRKRVAEELPQVCQRIKDGKKLSEEDQEALLEMSEKVIGTTENKKDYGTA